MHFLQIKKIYIENISTRIKICTQYNNEPDSSGIAY